jgi:hypothetical protein
MDDVREKLSHLNKEQAEAILQGEGVHDAVKTEISKLCPEWDDLWEVCVLCV